MSQLTAVQINKNKAKGAKKTAPSELMAYHDTWTKFLRERDPVFDDIQTIRDEFAQFGLIRGTRKSN